MDLGLIAILHLTNDAMKTVNKLVAIGGILDQLVCPPPPRSLKTKKTRRNVQQKIKILMFTLPF